MSRNKSSLSTSKIIVIAMSVLVLITGFMFGMPTYTVWAKEMRGRAALAEAEQNRQILILEGKARKEAAKEYAEAEVIRARGMAEAMEIENGQLNELYINYLKVRTFQQLGESGQIEQILYVPSNNIVPTMEMNENNN